MTTGDRVVKSGVTPTLKHMDCYLVYLLLFLTTRPTGLLQVVMSIHRLLLYFIGY